MEKNANYGDLEYWDKRFIDEDHFEWLDSATVFRDVLLGQLGSFGRDARILHVGCGSSKLSDMLWEDGYRSVTNVDYSQTLIDKLRESKPNMTWIRTDMRTCEGLEDASFDVVIEKATLDVLFVKDASPWEVSPEAAIDMDATLSSIHRVLKPGGLFLSISFTQPHFRVPFLVRDPRRWSLTVDRIGLHFHYYVYVMIKGERLDVDSLSSSLAITELPSQLAALGRGNEDEDDEERK